MRAQQSSSPIAPECPRTHGRLYGVALGLPLALLVAVGACGHDQIVDPRTDLPTLSDAIVSNPVSKVGGVSNIGGTAFSGAANLIDEDAIVYVSLPPGSLPNGEHVTIRNRHRGVVAAVMMLNGGFDPITVKAAMGDTLYFEFRLAGSVSSVHESHVVPPRRGPSVVRTDPPPKKPDVPLNAVMLVVFSEPISAAALTGSSVQLLLGGVPVAGTVRFGDSEQLALTFEPDEPLMPGAGYTLLVTQAISDLDGDALAEEMRIDFTTATVSATQAWAQVSAGDSHTCGVTTDQVTYCWGSNFSGQLGIGSTNNSTPFPTRVAGGLTFAQVSAGAGRSCGVTTGGVAYCWGWNKDGELGDGTLVDRNIPTRVIAGNATFAQVSVGRSLVIGHVSALATNGIAYSWRGLTDPEGVVRFWFDTTELRYVQVSAGSGHTCGVTANSTAYCWGANFWGEFGDGTIDSEAPSPERPVAGDLRFAQVSAGGNYTCGVTTDGTAYCWGLNVDGVLGDGTVVQRLTPTPVADNLRFAQVSAGSGHTCGVTTDHVAYCWGRNSYAPNPARGMLGDGTTEDRLTPTPVAGGLKFKQVSVGDSHTCGITTDGSLYCWGFNWSGQLGSQFGYSTGGSRLTPTLVELPK